MQTRSLYLLDTTFAGWDGAAVYRFDAPTGAMALVPGYAPSGSPFPFYEVAAVVGQGSYWVPTAPGNAVPASWLQDAFGGVEAVVLESGSAGLWSRAAGQPWMRPAKAVFWVGEMPLANNHLYAPAMNVGAIRGRFPEMGPPADSPPDTAVGGVKIHLRGNDLGRGARISARTLGATPLTGRSRHER